MSASGGGQAAAQGGASFTDAYRALRADPAIQFDLSRPPPPEKMPEWFHSLGHWLHLAFRPLVHLLRRIGAHLPQAPSARILLWSVLGLAAIAILWLIVDRIRTGAWRWRFRPKLASEGEAEPAWRPGTATARAWLNEAEALAEHGNFREAVHLLLRRSIEDIGRRRPQLLRPSLTSRDISANPALPMVARTIFADIARVVERSVFGSARVDASDWTRCRAAYAEFALGRSWSQ